MHAGGSLSINGFAALLSALFASCRCGLEIEMADEVARLKQEYDDAREAVRAAQMRVISTREAYHEAALNATGLRGHLVESERRTWKKTDTQRFVVEHIGRWSDAAVAGRVVKKDGKLGTREIEASLTGLKDLGVYEPRS
jgi:hypothetical protein